MVRRAIREAENQISECFSIRSFGSYGEAILAVIIGLLVGCFSIRSFGSYGEAVVNVIGLATCSQFQYPLFRIVW